MPLGPIKREACEHKTKRSVPMKDPDRMQYREQNEGRQPMSPTRSNQQK